MDESTKTVSGSVGMTIDESQKSAKEAEKDELFVYKVCTWLLALGGVAAAALLISLLSGCTCLVGAKVIPDKDLTGPIAGIDDFGGLGR